MTAASPFPTKIIGPLRRQAARFEAETGQPPAFWAEVAMLNLVTQMVFRRELGPGEFGTLNTALGVVALMAVPILALRWAFEQWLSGSPASARADAIRAAFPVMIKAAALAWAGFSLLLVFMLMPSLGVDRFSLHLFILLNVFVALGTVVSGMVCRSRGDRRLWAWLLVAAALERLLVGGYLGGKAPWAESALAAFLIAGFITLKPMLQEPETDWSILKSWRLWIDRDLLVHAGSTISVFVALFLFSSADRITAQSWFGSSSNNNMGYVNWEIFDAYQSAGLLARGLLWGTQPLLVILFLQRSGLAKTTPGSLRFFWIYGAALFLGAVLLSLLAHPVAAVFCGTDSFLTAQMLLPFAVVMLPLGALQALGVFVLASRRYPECFVLGGCGVLYAVLLGFLGRTPAMMLTYMFGGGAFSILVLLFVGVVRWGRKQP